MNNYTQEVLDYVIDTELDSFEDDPSEDHVYYKAVAARDGVDAADEALAEAEGDEA